MGSTALCLFTLVECKNESNIFVSTALSLCYSTNISRVPVEPELWELPVESLLLPRGDQEELSTWGTLLSRHQLPRVCSQPRAQVPPHQGLHHQQGKQLQQKVEKLPEEVDEQQHGKQREGGSSTLYKLYIFSYSTLCLFIMCPKQNVRSQSNGLE